MTAAMGAAAALGATGWQVAELLLAIRTGMAAGVAANRTTTAPPSGMGGGTLDGL